jgi:hypothetical protein
MSRFQINNTDGIRLNGLDLDATGGTLTGALIVNKVTMDKAVFTSDIQTNSLSATYDLAITDKNMIIFSADSNVTLGFTGAEVGTYIFVIDPAGFAVDLAIGGVWQSQSGLQPVISGKTIMTGIFDGTDMIVVEINKILDIT